jgi:hypothetical protein
MHVRELAAENGPFHGFGRLGRVLVSEILRITAEQIGSEQVAVPPRPRRRMPGHPPLVRPARHDDVLDVGPTARARLVGSVQGVVVHARARTPVSPRLSAFTPTSGNVTVTEGSCRIL